MPAAQLTMTDRISTLDLPEDQYALFGDAALAAHGLIDVDRIDLVVTEELYAALRQRGWVEHDDTDGEVLAQSGVTARTRVAVPRHPSTSVLIDDADRVDGLPVVKLPLVRQHVAARGASDAVVDRLDLIDRALGVKAPAPPIEPADADSRAWYDWPRSLTYLWGVLTAPARTFAAERGVPYWGLALVAASISCLLYVQANSRFDSPDLLVLGTPIVIGLGLLLQRVSTWVARLVCRGDSAVGSATASQAMAVSSLAMLPALIVDLVAVNVPVLSAVVSLLTVVAVYGSLGLLYGAAFGRSFSQGLAGAVVGTVAGVATIVAMALVILGIGAGLGGVAELIMLG